jgi:hypothetical protein
MARKRASSQKREREYQKRQRERKKAEKAAKKRERRFSRDESEQPEPQEGLDGATDEPEDIAP